MDSLRILYVDSDQTWRGGQEQLFSLMSGMKSRGHQLALAAPPHSPLAQKSGQLAIPIYPFRQRGELSPLALVKMARILRRSRPDVVHFNTPRVILSGGLVSQILGVPVRVSSRRVNFPLKSRLSCFKYNWMHDGILTVSFSIRRTLIGCGVSAHLITVVYEGVDLEWIDRQRTAPLLRDRTGPVVGTVAHLSPEKGHVTLLEAAARLAPRFPEVTYVLVGEGELESALREKARALGIEKQVIFTGFRSDSEGLMKQFDVFCLPSLSEGLSSAILMAMATRLPVVATDVGGIAELVLQGETGSLTPPDDTERLAAALAQLLASQSLRLRLGEGGRRRVEAHFTFAQKLDETERVYLQLLQQGGIK